MGDAINTCAIITFGGELSHRMPQNSLAGISGNCASLHQLCFLSIRTHCVGLSNLQIPNRQEVRPRPPLSQPLGGGVTKPT
jgi:hypothetical protein